MHLSVRTVMRQDTGSNNGNIENREDDNGIEWYNLNNESGLDIKSENR